MRQFIFICYCKTILLPAIITGLCIISSCSDSPKSTYIYSHSNIIYSQATDEPFTGRIIDTVANRIIKYDVKNGLKDGEFVIYFLNGKKEICGKVKANGVTITPTVNLSLKDISRMINQPINGYGIIQTAKRKKREIFWKEREKVFGKHIEKTGL